MGIRLNKALRELNIGLQTAVEFLERRSELGEVRAELSFRLNDRQYNALVEAFKQDAAVRAEAGKLFQKKPKEKKRAQEEKAESARPTSQKFTVLGKIDLDKVGKPAKAVAKEQKEAVKEVAPAEDAPKAVAKQQETETPVAVTVKEQAKPEKAKPAAEDEVAPVVSKNTDAPSETMKEEPVKKSVKEPAKATVQEPAKAAVQEPAKGKAAAAPHAAQDGEV